MLDETRYCVDISNRICGAILVEKANILTLEQHIKIASKKRFRKTGKKKNWKK